MVEAVAGALRVHVRTRVEPAGSEEVADTLADTTRLRALIGWSPETDIADLVARQVDRQVAAEQAGAARVERLPA